MNAQKILQAIKTGLEWFGLATTAAAFLALTIGTGGIATLVIIGVAGGVAFLVGARNSYRQSQRDEAHAQIEHEAHEREVKLEVALMDELQRHHVVEMKDESIATIAATLEHKEEKALPSNDRFFMRRSFTLPVQDHKNTDERNNKLHLQRGRL